MAADDLVLSLPQARRLAVRSQHPAGPEPAKGIDGMRQVPRELRVLRLDPVNVVARSHLLVLWSRLGGFDHDDLDALLWRERWLFEYWAPEFAEESTVSGHQMVAAIESLASFAGAASVSYSSPAAFGVS